MTDRAERLLRLAARIADSQDVDWDAELAAEEGEPTDLELFRVVDQVGKAHRRSTLLTTTLGRTSASISIRLPEPESNGDAPRAWGRFILFEHLGEGSFGQVFRVFDPRLQVEMALKLFPPNPPGGAEQFIAEARALARIRHPNVLAVHGVDEHDGRAGMWTDLLRGRTLEEILAWEGPFGAREAACIGIDLCRALAAVHAVRLVHGDIKASNVMRDRGGRIVLMDFGTAWESTSSSGGRHSSWIGTPIVLAPERLRGGPPTVGADLYALGVLLYRLVTGRYPVEAESLEMLLREQEMGRHVLLRDRRPDLPPGFTEIVERALHDSPDARWRSAGAMEKALVECVSQDLGVGGRLDPAGPEANGSASLRLSTRRLGSALVALAVVLAPALLAWLVVSLAGRRTADPDPAPIRVSLALPAGDRLQGYANASVSPDGATIAYSATDSTGIARLWIRRLDSVEARLLAGTEGAFYPFWSPDGKQIAFFARRALMTVGVNGGNLRRVCSASAGRGGSWGPDGTILFAPATQGPICEVQATGGIPVPVTRLATPAGEIAHRWPSWIDRERFLYVALPAEDGGFRVYVGFRRSDRRVHVVTASSAAVPAGRHLVYLDGERLAARPFDPARLRFTGEPIVLADAQRYEGSLGEPHASVSRNGSVVFPTWGNRMTELQWVERSGARRRTVASGPIVEPRLAPDGSRIVIEKSHSGTRSDLWLVDPESGAQEQWESMGARSRFPQWTEDGASIVYASNFRGTYQLHRRAVNGGSSSVLVTRPEVLLKWPTSCAAGLVAYSVFDPETGYDVWIRSESDSGAPLERTSSNETNAALSRDGSWVAFQSDRSGRDEIYLRPTRRGAARRVSDGGGRHPRWSADGRELFFYRPDRGQLMVASMPARPGTRPRPLFPAARLMSFDVDARGRRFLCCIESVPAPDELTVLTNWQR